MIAACDKHRIISQGGEIPWDSAGDFKFFREVTMGSNVIMGRKTWESIGSKDLPGRNNIVISSRGLVPTYDNRLKLCADSPSDARSFCDPEKDIWIIGGEEIYRAFLPVTPTVILCEFNGEINPDFNKEIRFFPMLSYHSMISTKKHPYDDRFTIRTYENRSLLEN